MNWCDYSMADVKTESLKAVDNITNPLVSTSSNSKMTVEKLPGQQPITKNKTAVKESSEESQSQPTSPKKTDPKTSPSGPQPPKSQTQQQQQQQAKSKGNPWHKNPSPTVSASGGKKAPEGGEVTSAAPGSSSPPQEESHTSKSIRIPKDEVCMCVKVVRVCVCL